MSYILTALKKSEAERAKGTVPRLTAQQAPAARSRGAAWPWIIGAALVANAAVVVLAWGPEVPPLTGSERKDASAPAVTRPLAQAGSDAVTAAVPAAPANGVEPARPAAPPPQAQRAPAEVEPPSAPARMAEAPPAPPQAARAVPVGQETRMDAVVARDTDANDNDQEPLPGSASRALATAPPGTVAQAPAVSATLGNAAAPRPPRKPVEALTLARPGPGLGDPVPLDGGSQAPAARPSAPELALAAPEPAPLESAPEAPAEPDPYAAVPMLWQLPSVIRSKLPKLSMSVHVYSPEAAGRFVIVDRKKYREGEVLTGGVKLEAIVADGIVLDYQGRRYRIGN